MRREVFISGLFTFLLILFVTGDVIHLISEHVLFPVSNFLSKTYPRTSSIFYVLGIVFQVYVMFYLYRSVGFFFGGLSVITFPETNSVKFTNSRTEFVVEGKDIISATQEVTLYGLCICIAFMNAQTGKKVEARIYYLADLRKLIDAINQFIPETQT